MSNKGLGVALSAPLIAGLIFTSSVAQQESAPSAPQANATHPHQADANQAGQQEANQPSCASSADAVTTLPAPLNRWADMICTQSGYVITGREDWLWIEPNHSALVVIPSQSFGAHAQMMESSAYFTKVELTKVTGEEFDKAYEVFHAGFDPKDAKPAGYRLDVTTSAGNEIRLYLFDYFTYGWGMACSKEACDASSRFVMLNMTVDPKPLPQPI